MECVKLNHLSPSFSDEFSTVNGLSGEDFFIDDLLNFHTDDGFFKEVDTSEVPKPTSPVKAVNDDKTTVPETELCLPVNDDCDLEWVSQFVNDSFSVDYSLTCLAQKFPVTETVTLVTVNPSFQNLVHKRARSKRCRTGGRVWSLRSPLPLPDSSTSCSSTSSSYTSNPLIAVVESLRKPPVQRQIKKKPAATSGRRCNHCFVQKTPQWRTGPSGAKTLCNACGVRFKSGRLLPEYRPACSPVFSSEFHSNNHRKVLEMRLKKMEKP